MTLSELILQLADEGCVVRFARASDALGPTLEVQVSHLASRSEMRVMVSMTEIKQARLEVLAMTLDKMLAAIRKAVANPPAAADA